MATRHKGLAVTPVVDSIPKFVEHVVDHTVLKLVVVEVVVEDLEVNLVVAGVVEDFRNLLHGIVASVPQLSDGEAGV